MMINSLTSNECFGCAACMDKCPPHAIHMIEDTDGNRVADIDESLCIQCGLCAQVCPNFHNTKETEFEKEAYVSFAKDKEQTKKSSSGGIFAILAKNILKRGGIVYGAAMTYENNQLRCKHIKVDNINDLPLLQGSKYVQSRTDGIFTSVKQDLSENRIVLFSGTSCQVASLKNFIGENQYKDSLFTIDLVCHGVPKDRIFRDYISFIEKKKQSQLIGMSFRMKEKLFFGVEDRFCLTLKYKDDSSIHHDEYISSKKSAYYSLFLNRAGYRDSCYHCKFTRLDKPADITLGDFIPRKNEIEKYNFNQGEHYSSIIIQNNRGYELLNTIKAELTITRFPIDEMLKHHPNLKSPSFTPRSGEEMFQIYLQEGFVGLQKKTDLHYMSYLIKTNIKNIITFIQKCK